MADRSREHANKGGTAEHEELTLCLIPADTDPVLVSVPKHDHLRALQQLVGGNIEGIYPSRSVTFFGESEARIAGKPTNVRASAMCEEAYGYPIVGDVVATCADADGDTASIDVDLLPFDVDPRVMPWQDAVHGLEVLRGML
jgi:hypothetical protein